MAYINEKQKPIKQRNFVVLLKLYAVFISSVIETSGISFIIGLATGTNVWTGT